MFARLRREFIYARGLGSGLLRTRRIGKRPGDVIGDHFRKWVASHGDKPALMSDAENLTYRQLDILADRYAGWAVGVGLKKGDVVALLMRNRPQYVAIWMGLSRAGVAAALLNTNLAGPALAHGIAVVNAKAVVLDPGLAANLRSAIATRDSSPPVYAVEDGTEFPQLSLPASATRITVDGPHPSDVALYIYTSGTTGLPKAARITHTRMLRIIYGFAAVSRAGPNDRMYNCLPMYHSNGGVIGIGVALSTGGSVFIREKFSQSAFWSEIAARRCTMFVYIGELCRYLQNAPPSPADRAHRIRLCVGNGLRPDIFAAFQKRFGIRDVLEFYAATEGNVALFNLDSHPGAIGRLPNWAAARFPLKIIAFDVDAGHEIRDAQGRCIEAKADEAGEMIGEIKDDPTMPAARFDGYADPEATRTKIMQDVFSAGDRWFRTGDLVRRDEDGYFYFVDRIGDTFRWKGENVSTTEVAETIAAYVGVLEATVYGVAIAGSEGRAGMAAIVVDETVFDLSGLRDYVAERLPVYARPLFLRFRKELDATGTFKVKKSDLVTEGFDPAKTIDRIIFDDPRNGAYRVVDAALVFDITSGAIRL